jgi:hypothetical protein
MRIFLGLSIFLLSTSFFPSFCQTENVSDNYLEFGGLISTTNHTPFWLHANKFGTIPLNGATATVRGSFNHSWILGKDKPDHFEGSKNTSKVNKGVKATFGSEAVLNISRSTQVILPQIYGALQYKNWEVSIGRRKQ